MNSLWNFSQRMHPHWTLNSCIAAFRSVWVHLELFRYCTKLGAKRAELVQLMQKFLPRSRFRIFRNERTRSTLLDPKLKYWFVSNCLCALWICFVIAQKSVQNGLNWTLNSCFRVFRSVSVHLAMFNYYTKLGAKWVELVQLIHKFVPLCHI